MALTITLSELRDAVRFRADCVGDDRVTDASLNRLINSAIRRLHAKLVALAEDDFTTRAALTTDPTGTYAELPSDFVALREIGWDPAGTVSIDEITTESDVVITTEASSHLVTESSGGITSSVTSRIYTMERFLLQERNRYSYTAGWSEGRPIAYRMIGPLGEPKRVEFMPPASTRCVVVVWYVPAPTTLSSDTDTWDGRSGFEEWVVLDAAAGVVIGEEGDATAIVSERENVWTTQIAPLYAARDQARPDRVVDVTREFTWFYDEPRRWYP